MTEWSEDRVKAIRQGLVQAIGRAAYGDETEVAEVFYALSQIIAAMTVRCARGDMEEAERLFLIVAQHTTNLIPDFERIRAAHEAATQAPASGTVN